MVFKIYLVVLLTLVSYSYRASSLKKDINITYLYVNQPPYENIINETWKFTFGGKTSKTLFGIISRSLNFITRKHCSHFKIIPKKVSSFKMMVNCLTSDNFTVLRQNGIDGDHFMMGPIPVSAKLYYTMHYNPERFSWLDDFATSKGLVVIRRIADVDLSKRILRAIGKSRLLLCFLAFMTGIIAAVMWLIDRSWTDEKEKALHRIFKKVYWAMVTMTTVGYGDIVPMTSPGKIIGVAWMMMSLIVVACMTSIITSDMVDSTVIINNQTTAVVAGTWDEFLGRLLVNHKRSSKNMAPFASYTELMDGLMHNDDIYAGLMDYNVAAMLQAEMRARDLGECNS